MTSIEDVIARSRQPGGFSEHRTFTLARDRAIEKMRQFALADPHYYILELIQSAIANNATFIDITLDDSQVLFSYVGGNYKKAELEQLFDFLFASNANVEQGSLRLLALGVNALMLFEPDEIILESGDGTLAGTTRVVINRGKGVVDVGTPEQALAGTFMRATGLKRRAMAKRSALEAVGGRPLEYTAIEERCIVAPVPVIVNSEPIFGYSRQRSPQLFGFSHTISFDEGDLYGTIGLASRKSSAVFRLVTHGAWVQTVGHDFLERVNTGYEEPLLGGVISFGPLRKTADHSGIVKDAVYDQMWQRLLPYLEQLRFGTQANRMANILHVGGARVTPVEVIQLIRDMKGVVILPVQKFATDKNLVEHARRIGEALSYPVLCVDDSQEAFVRSVAGDSWPVIAANVDDPGELSFYQKPENVLPARPWLIEPIDCPAVTMDEVNTYIDSKDLDKLHNGDAFELRKKFWGGTRAIRTTLYTQFDAEQRDGADKTWTDLRVWIQVGGRLVQEVRLPAFFPGQVLVVENPDMQPARLRQSVHKNEPPMAVMIAQALASMFATTIHESASDVIESLGAVNVAPDSLGARWIVAGLARATITRLNAEPGQDASMSIALVDYRLQSALMDVAVFTTLTGESRSVRDLSAMIQDGCGLIYGVVPEVEADLAGLDRGKILRLDMHLERLLVELLGEAAYVRVDGRDVLAEYRGVQCRDIALGLRNYIDFPLLVEGVDPTGWPEAEQRLCVLELLQQLKAQVASSRSDIPQENRRQALRHLQWFALNRADYALAKGITYIDNEPLFLTSDELVVAYDIVRSAQQRAGDLRMLDGMARDVVSPGPLFNKPRHEVSSFEARVELAMNPYLFWLLSARGHIVGLSVHASLGGDSDGFSQADEGDQTRYFAEMELKDDLLGGVLKIPFYEFYDDTGAAISGQKASGAVVAVSHDRQTVDVFEDIFHAFGVVGFVKVHSAGVERDALHGMVTDGARSLLNQQIHRVASGALTQGALYEQVVLYLLRYAGQHLQLHREADGRIGARVVDAMANRILELPLFTAQQGSPVSIRRLYYAFRNAHFTNPDAGFEDLQWASNLIALEEISDPLKAWLVAHFHPNRVRPVVERRREPVVEPVKVETSEVSEKQQALAASILYWFQVLRPDSGFFAVAPGAQEMPMRLEFGEHPQMVQRRGGRAEALLAVDVASRWQVLERNPGGDSAFLGLTVWLNPNHWMVQWALASGPGEARPLAWLLLAVYAQVNEVLEAVTNTDEQLFQQRVFSALQSKTLTWRRRRA